MIMIQMAGGLGNQMFTYALYKSFCEKNIPVCIEDWTHYNSDNGMKVEIANVFGVEYRKADLDEYVRLTDSSMRIDHRMHRKLFGRKEILYQEKDAIVFDPSIFDLQDAYVIGYFQSQRYFDNISDVIKREYVFDFEKYGDNILEYQKKMQESESVSIHVRRGDYLNKKFLKIYGDICTEAYYMSAKEYLKGKYKNCTFFLFTNDPEWGKAQECEDTVYVDAAGPDTAYLDMALMSCCRHHIIANSSFSWWGAWLDANPEKEVIAPARWLNTSGGRDIYAGLCNCLIDREGKIL